MIPLGGTQGLAVENSPHCWCTTPPNGLIHILTRTPQLLVPNKTDQGGGALQHRKLSSTIVTQISV